MSFSRVLTGVMGSGYYDHPGGGSNFVCLPDNPIYDKYIQGWQGTGAIYGTEYQPGNFPGFSKNLNNQDAPCAVCYVRSRGSQMMIPATNLKAAKNLNSTKILNSGFLKAKILKSPKILKSGFPLNSH